MFDSVNPNYVDLNKTDTLVDIIHFDAPEIVNSQIRIERVESGRNHYKDDLMSALDNLVALTVW